MWTVILQFLTLVGGGIAIGTILEDKPNQPVIIQQVPAIPAPVPITTPVALPRVAPDTSGAINPLLVVAIALLVLAAGYAVRSFRKT